MPIERALPPPIMAFPDGAVVRNLPANAGDMGLIPGSGRSPGGGNGNSFQYSYLENSMDRGTIQAAVCRVTNNHTQLSPPTHTAVLSFTLSIFSHLMMLGWMI